MLDKIHNSWCLFVKSKVYNIFPVMQKKKKKTYLYDCIDGAEQKNAGTLLNLDEIIYGNWP